MAVALADETNSGVDDIPADEVSGAPDEAGEDGPGEVGDGAAREGGTATPVGLGSGVGRETQAERSSKTARSAKDGRMEFALFKRLLLG